MPKGACRTLGGLPEAPTPRLVKGIVPNWILLMDPNFGFRSLFSAPFTLPTPPGWSSFPETRDLPPCLCSS